MNYSQKEPLDLRCVLFTKSKDVCVCVCVCVCELACTRMRDPTRLCSVSGTVWA